MSVHQFGRRTPVPQQAQQRLQPTVLPAPTRGLCLHENEAFMQPGGALVQDNWAPTMRGVKLRGGCIRHCDLHSEDVPVPPIGDAARKPVVSSFEYSSGNNQRMFAAQTTKLFDVTFGGPLLVKEGQTSGNYAAVQLANQGGDFLIAVNEAGDYPLRFNGSTWETLDGGEIHGPPDSGVEDGHGLSYVWKYRNRLFFIEVGTMNAWYLPLNAVEGALLQIPLSGAATKGGKLIFGTTWSLDAGDGADIKCVFCTSEGELLIFTGSDPGNAANWRQEGRYEISPPLGMNAHHPFGGELLIATVDGLAPISAAITKDSVQLELASVSREIKPMWRAEVVEKREHPWTMEKWDEYGALFVTWPYGKPGKRWCGIVNLATGAWARFVGWDATCFIKLRGNFYFGTQDGIVMQGDRTGYDDGNHAKIPYVATLVGSWGVLRTTPATTTWRQARASFVSGGNEPFKPQISATVDFVITIPPPPVAGVDPGLQEVWDQGLWDQAKWDQATAGTAAVRNTMWVSVGKTGYIHAPIVQVTVAQQVKPSVEMIAISATFEPGGITV